MAILHVLILQSSSCWSEELEESIQVGEIFFVIVLNTVNIPNVSPYTSNKYQCITYDTKYQGVIANLIDNRSLYLSRRVSIFKMEMEELYVISYSDFP